jgi:putative restriction endonuclease
MPEHLDHYIIQFSKLKADKGNQWIRSAETKQQAPHKPLLLLSVLDRFAEKTISDNLVKLDENLLEIFASYWSLVMPPEHRGNIAMPFFHLQSDRFWHLVVRPGQHVTTKIHTVSKLNETVCGAALDANLYHLLLQESSRDALRNVLLKEYFSEEVSQRLLNQGHVNRQAYQYSVKLVEQARHKLKERNPEYELENATAVRDQGFRMAVRQAYDYQCAITGLRLITDNGHIAVVGAHIVPWRVSYDDSPTNGIALSPTCHWAFDEGLLTVTSDYKVRSSPQLSKAQNRPQHLADLEGVRIVLPREEMFWPDKESLRWHNHKIFRRR